MMAARHRSASAKRWNLAPLVLAALPLALFLLVPLVTLVSQVAPSRFLADLLTDQVVRTISLSIVTTALTTVITIVAGTPVAYLLARRSFPGRGLFDMLIDLPMVLPPSVAGIALLVAFGQQAVIGRLLGDAGIGIAFSPVAVVLAQTFVAAPFFVKAAVAGFAGVDRELE
jgi:molybdate transport system permease protein